MNYYIVALIVLLPFHALAGEVCNKEEYQVLTTPAPPGNKYSIGTYNNTVIKKNTDFIVFGDSIAEQLFGAGLPVEVKSETPLALVGSGDGIQHALYRLEKFGDDLRKISPKRAIIVIGTNNIYMPACSIEAAFDYYIDKIREILPETRLYVVPILPRGDIFMQYEGSREEFNNYIEQHSREEKYTVIRVDDDDLRCGKTEESISQLYDAGNLVGECESIIGAENGMMRIDRYLMGRIRCEVRVIKVCDKYKDDHVHLSEKGIKTLISTIKDQIGPS